MLRFYHHGAKRGGSFTTCWQYRLWYWGAWFSWWKGTLRTNWYWNQQLFQWSIDTKSPSRLNCRTGIFSPAVRTDLLVNSRTIHTQILFLLLFTIWQAIWGSLKYSCSFKCCNFMLNLFYFSTFPPKLLDPVGSRATAILVNPNEKFCQITANTLNWSELKLTISSHYTLQARLPMLFYSTRITWVWRRRDSLIWGLLEILWSEAIWNGKRVLSRSKSPFFVNFFRRQTRPSAACWMVLSISMINHLNHWFFRIFALKPFADSLIFC